MDAKQSYYNESLSSSQVRNIMSSTAIAGPNGIDNVFGYGMIQADAAIMSFANPRPVITDYFHTPEDATPGVEAITLTVTGDYFIDNTTTFFLNGQALDLAPGSPTTGNTRDVLIPAYDELYPPFEAYNPPLIAGGSDGGYSDPIFITSKPTIVGTIQNETKYYGQSLPAGGFTVTYEIFYADETSLPLSAANLPADHYNRIMATAIETGADDDPESLNGALADVGSWPVFVSYNDPLNPLYTGSPVDPNSLEGQILYNYNFRFEDAVLVIEKLDMTLSPNDMEFTYGDDITGFTYNYDYDRSIIDDNVEIVMDGMITDNYFADMALDVAFLIDPESIEGDLGDLSNLSLFVSTNAYSQALALVNQLATGQALALVNGQSLAMATGQALALVNGQALALVNAQALALVNGQALALVNAMEMFTGQALALVNGQSTATGQALALVNAETILEIDSIPPDWDEATINGQALALVNGQALALVNGQALALVNGTSVDVLFNEEAIIILTADDIETAISTNGGSIELKSVNLITGNTVTNAGNPHSIVPGAFVTSNFNISYGLGNLTINPAPVIVTGTHQVINEGLPEPSYTGYNFAYNGFVMNESENDVFGNAGPPYSTPYVYPPGDPGIYPVSFTTPFGNYTFSLPDPVNLYVNPDDNGTKHVKPKLRCIDELGNNQFIAYFEYENDNADYVYVPVGPDNILTGENGATWTIQTPQPELFQPGGSNGTAWEVLFNGKKITWTISSQDHGHPSGVGSNAS
ncbi:MAG TPA: hypothetical protein VK994_02375, partial [Bacteroidales bacterium]|nr:hypothetical protein [Bacteroidales bacterium]